MFNPSTSGFATLPGPALHELLAGLGVAADALERPVRVAVEIAGPHAGLVHRTRRCVLTAGEGEVEFRVSALPLRELPTPRCACFVAEQLQGTHAVHLAHWALAARRELPALTDLDAVLIRSLRIRQLQFILRGLRRDATLASLRSTVLPDPLIAPAETLRAEVGACYDLLRAELQGARARHLLLNAPELRRQPLGPDRQALLGITHYRPHDLPYAGTLPDACVLAWWDEMPVPGCFSLVVPAPVASFCAELPREVGEVEYTLVEDTPSEREAIAAARALWSPGTEDPHASLVAALHSARLLLTP